MYQFSGAYCCNVTPRDYHIRSFTWCDVIAYYWRACVSVTIGVSYILQKNSVISFSSAAGNKILKFEREKKQGVVQIGIIGLSVNCRFTDSPI